MAEITSIAWTDHTFNPWIGCTNVSDGCLNCYAEILAKRFGLVQWGDHPRYRTVLESWRNGLSRERRLNWNEPKIVWDWAWA